MESIRDYLAAQRTPLVQELTGLIRLRSVAGLPEHEIDLVRSANWLAAVLREVGFPTVQVWGSGGGPAVYAEWCTTGDAPTVLVYSHHDVRAAKDDERDTIEPPPAVALPEPRALELETVMLPRDAFFARTEQIPTSAGCTLWEV
jgi:acetylornithine deacetylase/succinyl-diaminopimelate desuccinylase-like protein